jgi:serine/threonine protein kinase
LNKIGILEDSLTFSEDKKQIRKLYIDYLSQLIQSVNTKKNKNLIEINNDNVTNHICVSNSQYTNSFLELEKIGEGGFGEVFKSYNYIDAQLYAIKKIPFIDVNDPNNIRAFNEVRYLSKLNHENIIRYNSTWIELSDKKTELIDGNISVYPVLYIQMELCKESLKDYLMRRNYSGQLIDFDFEIKCIKGIIEGIKYIHSNNILHRDINPNNIFIDQNLSPKIGDFGLSMKSEHEDANTIMSSDLGVSLYMPPEYKENKIYNKKSDVYSCGIVFFELLYIFKTDMERYEIISEIKKNIYPISFINKFDKYYELIKNMLEYDLEKRLDINIIK